MKNYFPHLIPEVEKWPIYQISKNREQFVKDLNEFTYARMLLLHKDRIGQLLEKTIYLEKKRSKRTPWKVDPPNEVGYWKSLESELRKIEDSGTEEEGYDQLLKRIINRYSEEITGSFSVRTFNFSRKFLTSFFKRLLNTAAGRNHRRIWGNKHQLRDRIIVNGYVEEFRALFAKGTVVVVPTHFSNLDSIMIGYIMDHVVGVPAFAYGAGLNLYEQELVAYFINRLGAYKVDRRKKNPIYLECLKSMACYSLQEGVNNIFFPGGTRSRNGSIEKRLKLGLLGSVVESQRIHIQKGEKDKIFVVPIILGYNFVLEAKFLINQYLKTTGREKYVKLKDQYNGYSKIMKFIWALFKEKSEIMLTFGEPLDVLGNQVDKNGKSIDNQGNNIDLEEYFQWEGDINIDSQRETVYTKMLGDRILESYYKNNYVLASHLVAYCAFRILMLENPEVSIFELVNLPASELKIPVEEYKKVLIQLRDGIVAWEKLGKIKCYQEIKVTDLDELIVTGIKKLGTYHPAKVLYEKNGFIGSEDLHLLYYYHNRLENYKMEKLINWNSVIDPASKLGSEG